MDPFLEEGNEFGQRKGGGIFGALLVGTRVLIVFVVEIQHRDKGRGRLGNDIFDEPVEEFSTIFDGQFRVSGKLSTTVSRMTSGAAQLAYLAQGVENVVEEDQNLAFGHLGNIVHGLAGVVSHASILIGEACEDWWHYHMQIAGNFVLEERPSDASIDRSLGLTEPRAIEAAARPISPPLRA